MIFNHRKTGKCAVFIYPYNSEFKPHECAFRIRKPEDLPDLEFSLTDVGVPRFFADPTVRNYSGKKGLFHYLIAFFMDGFFDEKDPEKKKKIEEEARKAEKDFVFLICPSGFPDRYVQGIGQYDMFGDFISKEKVLSFEIPIDEYRIVKSFVELEKSAMHNPERFKELAEHRKAKEDYDNIFRPWYKALSTEQQIEVDKVLPAIA